MRRFCILTTVLTAVVGLPAIAQTSSSTAAPVRKTAAGHTAAKPSTAARKPVPAPMTEEQKVIYSLGLSIYQSLGHFDLSPAEIDLVKRAISDAQANKPAVNLETYGPKIRELEQERTARAAAKEKAESAAYLTKAATEPGATKTDSGLIYTDLVPGTGASPKATDKVKVNYRGTLINGKEFDSSYARNEPAEFPLNGVIPCWTEGLQKMKVGGKARLVCPSNIAYGDAGHPPVIPGGAALVFEVELLSVNGGN